MKYFTMILIVGLCGCSGAALKSEWKDKRGYSDADTQEIMSKMENYKGILIAGKQNSNGFNSAPYTDAKNRLKSTFCSCVKKMGDKCKTKEGSSIDHDLWIKANAVDMAFASQESSIDVMPSERLDSAECN